MRSLTPDYLGKIKLSPAQGANLRAIGESRGRQELYSRQTPEVLKSLREVAVVESIECSNRIEGVVAPHTRIEAIAHKSSTPKNRSEQEIAGYRDALALIHETTRDMPVTTNVVLQLHSMIYRYMPEDGGNWKTTENTIVDRAPDGKVIRIRFKTASAFDTPRAMTALVEQYAAALTMPTDPLLVIPLAILDFLCIHPFSDGNGRVARLLTLLMLYHHHYEVGRYISLERVIEESKATYYETLEASSQGWHEGEHDPHPWLNYFWGVLIRAYSEFEERVGQMDGGKGAKTLQIRHAVARRTIPFAISDIERDCPAVSRDMIRLVLRQLRDEGVIVSKGRGRAAKWVPTGQQHDESDGQMDFLHSEGQE